MHKVTVFSGRGIPAFIAGIMIFCSILGFCGKGAVSAAVFIPLICGVIFYLVIVRRVRFEADHAVMYYCTFFPVRLKYADVTGVGAIYWDFKNPDVPSLIAFELRSGKSSSWNLSFFAPDNRKKIKAELDSRIVLTGTTRQIPDIQLWVDRVCRASRMERIISCAAAIIMFVFGFCAMSSQLVWNERVKNWDKVDGIILKNDIRHIQRAKGGSTEVSDVEYKYTYKGKNYRGTKIVYDSKSFPAVKVGKKRQVIVNPDDPRQSAVMFKYRGHWGWTRYFECIFFYLASLLAGASFFRTLSRKTKEVPAKLKSYIASIPPERFYAALDMERPAQRSQAAVIEMSHPLEYSLDHRYGIIRRRASWLSCLVFAVLFLTAVAAAQVMPFCLIIAAGIGFIIYSSLLPRVAVFDFQEKKLFHCKRFVPEKSGKMKGIPFAEIDHLKCLACRGRHCGKSIALLAIRRNGMPVEICQVPEKSFHLLFDMLPELAARMGNLPVTYF